jgi:hypothetical protein
MTKIEIDTGKVLHTAFCYYKNANFFHHIQKWSSDEAAGQNESEFWSWCFLISKVWWDQKKSKTISSQRPSSSSYDPFTRFNIYDKEFIEKIKL